jgi:hypothetical protein
MEKSKASHKNKTARTTVVIGRVACCFLLLPSDIGHDLLPQVLQEIMDGN